MKLTSDAAAPTPCVCGTVVAADLYRAPDVDFRDPAGDVIAARGDRSSPVDDTVYFFASTDPAADGKAVCSLEGASMGVH